MKMFVEFLGATLKEHPFELYFLDVSNDVVLILTKQREGNYTLEEFQDFIQLVLLPNNAKD